MRRNRVRSQPEGRKVADRHSGNPLRGKAHARRASGLRVEPAGIRRLFLAKPARKCLHAEHRAWWNPKRVASCGQHSVSVRSRRGERGAATVASGVQYPPTSGMQNPGAGDVIALPPSCNSGALACPRRCLLKSVRSRHTHGVSACGGIRHGQPLRPNPVCSTSSRLRGAGAS